MKKRILFWLFVVCLVSCMMSACAPEKKQITADMVGEIAEQAYTGQAIEPQVTVEGLTEGQDYEVSFQNNTEIGEAQATITGKGDYTGTVQKKFTIGKGVPTIRENPVAAEIVYGTALADCNLTGGSADVEGTFAWADGEKVPTVTENDCEVLFTPQDAAHYNSVTLTVKVTVQKADAVVETAPAVQVTTLRAGEPLPELTQGKANFPGTFAWVTDQEMKLGTTEYEWVFLPSEPDSVNVAKGKIALTVEKGVPVIRQLPTASVITYGTSLEDCALQGGVAEIDGAAVEGAFRWKEAGGTKPEVNNTGYFVEFVPKNTELYDTVSSVEKVLVTVERAAVTIQELPVAQAITFGQTLEESALTGGVAKSGETVLEGAFLWKNPDLLPEVENGGFAVLFVPQNKNYQSAEGTAELTVNPLTVTVEATNLLQRYDGTPKAVTVKTNPEMTEYRVTYRSDTYEESETAPAETGEYTVTIASTSANYVLSGETTFTLRIFDEQVLENAQYLFSKIDGATQSPVYDISAVTGEVAGVQLGETTLQEGEYTVSGTQLTISEEALKAQPNGIHAVTISSSTGSIYTASIYICDVVIHAENWRDYLTKPNGASDTTLATDDTATFAGSDQTRLSAWYVLATDITYGAEDVFPGIGRSTMSAGIKPFTGVFDGNGYTIKDWELRAYSSTGAVLNKVTGGGAAGFVSRMSGNAVLKNLTLENPSILYQATKSSSYAAAFVGHIYKPANAIIENCVLNGGSISVSTPAGLWTTASMFVAQQQSGVTVKRCMAYGAISLTAKSGEADANNLVLSTGSGTSMQGKYEDVFVLSTVTAQDLHMYAIGVDGAVTEKVVDTLYSEEQLKGSAAEGNADYTAFSETEWNIQSGVLPTLKKGVYRIG